MCIAFIHGSLRYGRQGILVLFGLCTVVGYGMENLSIATDFPFGFYHYTNLFHLPQIGRVPLRAIASKVVYDQGLKNVVVNA
ncbi:MAG: carotenoid biosynthesis protein [Burkholderiales bacterium]|nr:carotenoid biosynthesis protein [Burkholderiales bacterium]